MLLIVDPLTYISDDDTFEALTPYHLLFGRNINNRVKVSNDAEVELNSEQCSKRVKTLQLTLNQFWNRFRTEYLGQLREKHSYVKGKFNNDCNIEVGDVVLIKEDKFVPRGQWRKGRVENVIQGKDGMIRGASLRVYLKDGKTIILKRPVQKLVPFEIQAAVKQENKQEETRVADDNTNDAGIVRPRRNAALSGELIRKLAGQE